MGEIWKDVEGYEGLYQVSNLGRVRSLYTNRQLKKISTSTGYHAVGLYKDGRSKRCSVHRLVAQAFLPNPERKATVNHKNGDKHDNCADNLEWATHEENQRHAVQTGLWVNANHKNNKLSIPVAQYDLDMNLIRIFPSINEARRCGFRADEICRCCKGINKTSGGYIWKYV